MRILLDENLPHRLRLLLPGHEIRTAAFDAILTADQGIRYQQNRKSSRVALIVLSNNDESVISSNVNTILAAINEVKPGALFWVELESRSNG
jgi:predicted nuclease of predicted toxin-antitoxin system